MNYWDSAREIQRLVESFRAIEDQARQFQLLQDRLRDGLEPFMRAQDVAREFARAQIAFAQPPALLASAQILQAAIRPFADLQAFGLDVEGVAALAERMNRAIVNARFLAELDLSDIEMHRQQEPGGDAVAQEAESRLVEIASPDALQALRRVEFAPIVLLDRALRDPELMRQMGARSFEGFVASLVEQLGFDEVLLTPSSHDGGRDVLATKRVHGLSIVFAFECKRYAADRPVGPDIARALLGTIMHGATRATKGVLVTTSRFTPAARSFIVTEPNLDGKDFDGIVEWLREYGSKKHAT